MEKKMPKDKELNNVTDLRDRKPKQKEAPQDVSKTRKRLSWKLIVTTGVVLILLINGIFIYGIYAKGWNDKITKIFVKIFPYPAATLSGGYVRVSNYYEDLDSYKKYYEVAQKIDFKNEEGQKIFKTLKDDLLSQLIEEKIIKQEAKKFSLKVESSEVEEEYQNLVKENGEDTLKNLIKEYHNWDVKTFKEKIKAMLLGRKLEEKIKNDKDLNKDKEESANNILKKLKNGEDFAKLAKEVSEHPSKDDGGNLGWSEKGKNPSEVDDVAFNLSPGEISNIIRTTDGFYIVKVNDKKENEISMSIILIKSVDFESWLKEKATEYKVKKLLNLDKIKG